MKGEENMEVDPISVPPPQPAESPAPEETPKEAPATNQTETPVPPTEGTGENIDYFA